MATLAASERSDYYTYEETADLLCISYKHLLRVIGLGVFHPVKLAWGARKYIPRSEVDAKVGKILYSLRRPKTVQRQEQLSPHPKRQTFTYVTFLPVVVESDTPLSDEDLGKMEQSIAKVEEKRISKLASLDACKRVYSELLQA